ncbi:MAG: response regulator [Desulfobulbaceae bacterium]|nr:response regulator [Desulfobulbaceae bacterium]
MRFLIIEDEVTARTVLKNHLRRAVPGCELLEAENGLQGLCLLLTEKPDIVFLDIIMPVMNGWELLDVVEKAHANGQLSQRPRIIVVTKISTFPELKKLTDRMIVETVISKPITRQMVSAFRESLSWR